MFRFVFIFFYFSISSQELIETIEIDGSNLPDSQGTIIEGERLFLNYCSNCHGNSGEGRIGPELVGRSQLLGDKVSKTIGNYWPYAPKIFDYIKRVKRSGRDEYFSNSQVYSLTGFLLRENGLFNDENINKEKLSKIKMPNRDGFIVEYHY
jgi:cytochrome c